MVYAAFAASYAFTELLIMWLSLTCHGNLLCLCCSAGIGRTGVLITMETAMCLIEANQPVYPLDIVRQMRDQRAMLIQTSVRPSYKALRRRVSVAWWIAAAVMHIIGHICSCASLFLVFH